MLNKKATLMSLAMFTPTAAIVVNSGQRLERPGLDALRDAIWQGRYDQLVIFSW